MSVVLFAYHEMGCVALRTLLDLGIEVCAVFTHRDDPAENHWFGSVAEAATDAGIEVFAPEDVNAAPWVERLGALAPELLLSVHYRRILRRALRRVPRRGCVNLHPSLLPRYRGRCPINWQLIHGEPQSGVTLHHMVARADAGDIVDQEAVEVGPNDTALDLYWRLVPAAEAVLRRSLPALLAGTASRRPQDESRASTFGGRTPSDGRIDWSWPARRIHDLVRAVAPPWPGAFCEGPGGRLEVHATRPRPWGEDWPPFSPGGVWADGEGQRVVRAGDGEGLELLRVAGELPPAGARLR